MQQDYLSFMVLYFLNNKHAWLIVFFAVIISRAVIIYFWKDAQFGMLPNIPILVVLIISFGHYTFYKLVQHETAATLSKVSPPNDKIIIPSQRYYWLFSFRALGLRNRLRQERFNPARLRYIQTGFKVYQNFNLFQG